MPDSLTLVRHIAAAVMLSGGSQNFLGSGSVEKLVWAAPPRYRRGVALRLLALSPHYFHGRDVSAEDLRLRTSRRRIVDGLVRPFVDPASTVIDFGCGPGYLARASADIAGRVIGVDISRGALACAAVLNSASNIDYVEPSGLSRVAADVDVAYSIAVAQHLSDEALIDSLTLLAASMRSGGTLVVHFATPEFLMPEHAWRADRSLKGRLKLRWGLHCFGRSAQEMIDIASSAGFTDLRVSPVADLVHDLVDDITQQHLLVGTRK